MKFLTLMFVLIAASCFSQEAVFTLEGRVLDAQSKPVPFCSVALLNTTYGTSTNSDGKFKIEKIPAGNYSLVIVNTGFKKSEQLLTIPSKDVLVRLLSQDSNLEEIVVTGTMREVSKDESPINIDIVTPQLFQKTSTPNLFEATSLVNGVKPQINCNVCNTGDIHINGMEGPYTLILIDGMPIVSGLSSVYGLMGIPASMIERLEIAKGPTGALYGSEAMGGTINLITKNPSRAPKFYVDYYASSYLENNLDLSAKFKLGKKVDWLVGSNAFIYDNKKDINNDGFTDITLQKRFSLFNKISVDRKSGKEFTMAARLVTEDRWGGEMNWNKNFRGGDSVYGESIYANRAEFISKYEWPTKEKIFTQISYNLHDQNSVYGSSYFIARQSTAFAQTYWHKKFGERNEVLAGINYKSLWYDDNTAVTQKFDESGNQPELNNTLGVFFQDEMTLDSLSKHKLLFGLRVDYNDVYRFIPSPRIAYKWAPTYKLIFRANFGTGFRIVNVFTEDHAALTGAREVVFTEQIEPERSYNGSLNAIYKMKVGKSSMIIWDLSTFYYHFTNKIFANYDLDPEKVIYRNLEGHAFSRGFALSAALASPKNFKFNLGITYSDVQNMSRDSSGVVSSMRQLMTPVWSGNMIISYHFQKPNIKVDVTGNWYGPQRLPIFPHDFRPEYSPWFCLLNLQISKTFSEKYEMYVGGKNLLNFLPKHPIMRPFDPFDKNASDVVSNPNGYTFDPSYSYAPMQSIRGYLGVRITL